jgi:hypothetical protein
MKETTVEYAGGEKQKGKKSEKHFLWVILHCCTHLRPDRDVKMVWKKAVVT